MITEIEANYAELVGTERFEVAAETLGRLLSSLTAASRAEVEL